MATLSVYWRARDGCRKRPMFARMTKWESQTEARFEPATRFRPGFRPFRNWDSSRFHIIKVTSFWKIFITLRGIFLDIPTHVRNGWADCVQIWCLDRDSLAACSLHVIGEMSLHVRTCNDHILEMASSILFKFAVWVGTHKTQASHRILVECLSTFARAHPFSLSRK